MLNDFKTSATRHSAGLCIQVHSTPFSQVHLIARSQVLTDNGLSPEIIDQHYVTASLLRGLPFLV